MDDYWSYLESIKEKIPLELFNFLRNEDRYVPTNENCLHDSWIREIKISEKKDKRTIIQIALLGPFHDRIFKFVFSDVNKFKSKLKEKNFGDLLMHEFWLDGNNFFNYDFQLENGSISINCSKIDFSEVLK